MSREDFIRNRVLPILFFVGGFAVLYMAWMTPFASSDLERFQNMMKVGGILVVAFAVPQMLSQLQKRQVEVDDEGRERPVVRERPVIREDPERREGPVSQESRSLLFLGVGMMLLEVLMIIDNWIFGGVYLFPPGLLMGLGLALVIFMLPRVVPNIERLVFQGDWVHPWVDDRMRRLREKQRKALEEQREK